MAEPTSRMDEIQKRWLNEPLHGKNGENYSADYGYLLNTIYAMQVHIEDLNDQIEFLQGRCQDYEVELLERED